MHPNTKILMSIITGLLGIFCSVFGWWEKQVYNDMQTMKMAVKELQDGQKYFHGRDARVYTDIEVQDKK